jgi:hypothetical protein
MRHGHALELRRHALVEQRPQPHKHRQGQRKLKDFVEKHTRLETGQHRNKKEP